MKSPTSRHFRIRQLAEGVYAAIQRDGGWAISNAGIVDLGDRTLVFDSMLTPHAAADLRLAAEVLTGRPVSTLVNSHYHNDHIWGNQAFDPSTDIVATVETRELIATAGQEEYDWYRAHAPDRLESLLAERDAAQEETQREALTWLISYYEGMVEALPLLTVRLPNLTFVDRLDLHGTQRLAQLLCFGGGHTGSDALLYLPAEGIVFLSDLLFIGCHPYLPDGNPEQALRILRRVADLEPVLVVPGHGPVGTAADLVRMGGYIAVCEEMAERLLEDEEPEESVERAVPPRPFDRWAFASFYAANLRFFYQRLA